MVYVPLKREKIILDEDIIGGILGMKKAQPYRRGDNAGQVIQANI